MEGLIVRALLLYLAGLLMVITPGGDAAALSAALVQAGTGLTISGLTISGNSLAGVNTQSWGTYTNVSGIYGGIGPGIVLSTGKVADFNDGPQNPHPNNPATYFGTNFGTNATAAQIALLQQIVPSGGSGWHDVTQIDVNFALDSGHDSIIFNVVFGSNEYPVFVGPGFVDSFGLFVNGSNIAFDGGVPVDINNPDFASIPGTQLNGVLAPGGNPLLSFSKPVGRGASGTLTLIVADQSDNFYDTTAWINGLGGAVLGILPGSAINAGGRRTLKCVSRVQESPMVDWASLQRKLEKERPQPLPETRWKG